MQVSLRHFNKNDISFIAQKLWPNTTDEEAVAMMSEWDTLKHNSSYFEMFAIEVDSELAGCASIYEIGGNASIGIEITYEHRNKGVGCQAAIEVARHAKELGYNKAVARVLTGNLPSLRLCEKAGFYIRGNDVTADGKEVYNLEKML